MIKPNELVDIKTAYTDVLLTESKSSNLRVYRSDKIPKNKTSLRDSLLGDYNGFSELNGAAWVAETEIMSDKQRMRLEFLADMDGVSVAIHRLDNGAWDAPAIFSKDWHKAKINAEAAKNQLQNIFPDIDAIIKNWDLVEDQDRDEYFTKRKHGSKELDESLDYQQNIDNSNPWAIAEHEVGELVTQLANKRSESRARRDKSPGGPEWRHLDSEYYVWDLAVQIAERSLSKIMRRRSAKVK